MMKTTIQLHLMFVLMVYGFTRANAQEPIFYQANGKNVNVAAFNKEVQQMMDDLGVPGLSLAIIDQNRISFSHTYGYRELENKLPADSETIFEAASLSKSFLVFVVHQLIEEGKLELDKPIWQYLDYEPLKHDVRYRQITVRMLLSHCSGMENWRGENNADTLELLSDPGKRFVYSGEGYQYLAKVVESILHRSYGEYINDKVIQPLGLKRTFSVYDEKRGGADNYATGYNNFGKAVQKWKNNETVPASGMHLTAADYARLMIAIFDGEHLSARTAREIVRQGIPMDKDNPALYFGLGFGVICNAGDTIVFHNGSNRGFKAWAWYSVVKKCGFVVLTNGDRGVATAKRIDELSTGLNLDPYYGSDAVFEQYPSTATELLKIYRQEGTAAMLARTEALEKDHQIKAKTLNEMAWFFFGENKIAKKLLEDNIRLYPTSPFAFFLLGELHLALGEYEQAYQRLTKAKELNFQMVPLEPDIKKCEAKLKQQIH